MTNKKKQLLPVFNANVLFFSFTAAKLLEVRVGGSAYKILDVIIFMLFQLFSPSKHFFCEIQNKCFFDKYCQHFPFITIFFCSRQNFHSYLIQKLFALSLNCPLSVGLMHSDSVQANT